MTNSAQCLLIVCDEQGDPTSLVQRYLAVGYEVDRAYGAAAAAAVLQQQECSVVVADLPAADEAALALLRAARRSRPVPHVVLLLPRTSDDTPLVLALVREVAYVCLRHHVDLEELDDLIAAACLEVEQERFAARSAPFARGMRDIRRWQEAQEALESALVAVASLGPLATRELLAEAADEVGRQLRADRNASLDAVAMASFAGALRDWATHGLLGHRAA